MKKLILSAAVLLGSVITFTANAQTQAAVQTQDQNPTEKATTVTDGYTEIKAEELPQAITEALKKAFPDAVLGKAYINDKKEYRLDVKVGDKEGSLFADEKGKWIQK